MNVVLTSLSRMSENQLFAVGKRSRSEEDDNAGPPRKLVVIEAGQSTGKTRKKNRCLHYCRSKWTVYLECDKTCVYLVKLRVHRHGFILFNVITLSYSIMHASYTGLSALIFSAFGF